MRRFGEKLVQGDRQRDRQRDRDEWQFIGPNPPDGRRTKNGQNTDLNNQNVEFGGPLKASKWPRMNLPMETTNFYVQKYRDITLNRKLGQIRE